MFFLAKLAVVSSIFYISIAAILDFAVFGMARWKGGFMFSINRGGWCALFGVIWLASFAISWRIIMTPMLARISALTK
jgi:hypothetical protein